MPKLNISKHKNWIVLSVAIAVGGLTAFGARQYLRNEMEELSGANKKEETVAVLVAKKDLASGDQLAKDTIASRKVPKEWVHANALRPSDFDAVKGRSLRIAAVKGQPILWAQLDGGRAPNFSAKLTEGRRAVTVPVDEISSISGMVSPGDRIDLVVSIKRADKNINFTLLQSVRVLATGSRDTVDLNAKDGAKRSFTTITLDTTPDDARRVIAARERGRITALLRAPEDVAEVSSARSDADALLGLSPGNALNGMSTVPVIYGGGQIKEVLPAVGSLGASMQKQSEATPAAVPSELPFGYR